MEPKKPTYQPPESIEWDQMLEQYRPAMMALRTEEVLPVNICGDQAGTTVVEAVYRAARHFDALVRHTDVDAALLDQLWCLAWAVKYVAAVVTRPKDPVRALAARCRVLRREAIQVLTPLAQRGLVGGAALRDLSSARGHLDLAVDIGRLAVVLRTHWADIENKCPFVEAEIAEMEAIGVALVKARAMRSVKLETLAPSVILARALTLLRHRYDALRRALQYVRFYEGDAEVIAPSLHCKRRRRARKPSPVKRSLDAARLDALLASTVAGEELGEALGPVGDRSDRAEQGDLGHQPELLDHPELVPGRPALDDLTALEAEEVHAVDARELLGRRQPHEGAGHGAAGGVTNRDQVGLADHLVHPELEVGERSEVALRHLFDPRRAGDLGAATNVVRREDLVRCVEVAPVP